MNWWQWILLVLAVYALIGLAVGIYSKSAFVGLIWPASALWMLFGNVQ